jgi:hypothetical protein
LICRGQRNRFGHLGLDYTCVGRHTAPQPLSTGTAATRKPMLARRLKG